MYRSCGLKLIYQIYRFRIFMSIFGVFLIYLLLRFLKSHINIYLLLRFLKNHFKHFEVCSSVVFSMVTVSSSHDCYIIPARNFLTPEGHPVPSKSSRCSPSLPPLQPPIHFMPLVLPLLYISCRWRPVMCALLCLRMFSGFIHVVACDSISLLMRLFI